MSEFVVSGEDAILKDLPGVFPNEADILVGADKIFAALPTVGSPAFPAGWRTTKGGLLVKCFLANTKRPNFHLLTTGDKNKCRFLYPDFDSGRIPILVTEDFSAQLGDDNTFLENKRVKDAATLGDVIHGLHIKLLMFIRGEQHKDREAFLNKYLSNVHQAEWFSKRFNLPMPKTPTGIHNFGTRFEAQYFRTFNFRAEYLTDVFGSIHASEAIHFSFLIFDPKNRMDLAASDKMIMQ